MLNSFEKIVRKVGQFTQESVGSSGDAHPFLQREIFEGFPPKVKQLFDDNYYAEATFEAFKFLDRKISKLASISETGQKLMMQAFAETGPLRLTNLSSETEIAEQNGFRFLFAGAMAAVRNPRGHEYNVSDRLEVCLDHLSLASLLARRLLEAGFDLS